MANSGKLVMIQRQIRGRAIFDPRPLAISPRMNESHHTLSRTPVTSMYTYVCTRVWLCQTISYVFACTALIVYALSSVSTISYVFFLCASSSVSVQRWRHMHTWTLWQDKALTGYISLQVQPVSGSFSLQKEPSFSQVNVCEKTICITGMAKTNTCACPCS